MDGPGHDGFSLPSSLAQHEAPFADFPAGFGSQQVLPQCPSQVPAHAQAGSWVGRVAIPRRNSPLIRSTHITQWALPGFIAFDAAIHCSSANSTTGGGITPFWIAHISRWCSEWQQQFVQHSVAEAHPQPQDSQGYRSPAIRPNHPIMTRGEGNTPNDTTR